MVAAKDRYHTLCQSIFMVNPTPKFASRGIPLSSAKLAAFNFMCDKIEDHFKLWTIKEFYEAKEKVGHNVDSSKMTIIKLKPMYFQ